MTEVEGRLRGELRDVFDRIRRVGGGVVFEEFPGAFEDASNGGPTDDDGSATRRALIDEANKLGETLERIRRGEDGI
jgi:hypothetical protein